MYTYTTIYSCLKKYMWIQLKIFSGANDRLTVKRKREENILYVCRPKIYQNNKKVGGHQVFLFNIRFYYKL